MGSFFGSNLLYDSVAITSATEVVIVGIANMDILTEL